MFTSIILASLTLASYCNAAAIEGTSTKTLTTTKVVTPSTVHETKTVVVGATKTVVVTECIPTTEMGIAKRPKATPRVSKRAVNEAESSVKTVTTTLTKTETAADATHIKTMTKSTTSTVTSTSYLIPSPTFVVKDSSSSLYWSLTGYEDFGLQNFGLTLEPKSSATTFYYNATDGQISVLATGSYNGETYSVLLYSEQDPYSSGYEGIYFSPYDGGIEYADPKVTFTFNNDCTISALNGYDDGYLNTKHEVIDKLQNCDGIPSLLTSSDASKTDKKGECVPATYIAEAL